MSDWVPILTLPNLLLREAIGDDHIAVAPIKDRRVHEALIEQPRVAEFLSRFTNEFGDALEPTVLMVKQDTNPSYRDTSAIAGYRDVLAIVTIPHARALKITHDGSMGAPLWAETFSIYPWMVDRHGKSLIGQTPAMFGSHQVERFHGQAEAGLPQHVVELNNIDKPVFEELLRRWHRRFSDNEVSWQDRALFRSLNMARAAMLMPGGVEYDFYDVGRLLALWISAFEILLHPGPGGRVGKHQVLEILDTAEWLDERCSSRTTHITIGKHTTARTIALGLCKKMYGLRDDFLHGNDVSAGQLSINGVPFLLLASSLYRVMLVAILEIHAPPFIEDDADEAAMSRHVIDLIKWNDPQRRHEKAILKTDITIAEADVPAPQS